MWLKVRILLLVLSTALLGREAVSQVSSAGIVGGTVTDTSGAVIPGVEVTATQAQTNVQWHANTDTNGSYIFVNLPAASYRVSAQKNGFSKTELPELVLHTGERLKVDLALKPGSVAETVTVTSNAVAVDTETGNVGEVVASQAIEDLPLVTRNFIQLVALVPGVSSDIGSEAGFGSNSGLSASVNGVRENSNNWTIDGAPNLDVYNSNNAIVPNVDAIQEFRIDRGNYTAEQGRSSGASINAIIKSGTNQFHGSAFEFMRNGYLNANNYFSNLNGVPRPPDHYNNWGYTFGGPMKKDKLFFFWSEEWRRISQSTGTAQARVPTDLEKGGDFSNYAALGVPQPVVPASLATNPACTGCIPGEPFPNNKLPAALMSSNSLILLNTYYPSAGAYSNGYNYASAKPTITTVREELIRLDYSLNERWKAFAHYIQDQNHITSPYSLWNSNHLPDVAGSKEFEPLHSFAINLVGSVTPNVVNETQFSIYHNIIRISIDPTASRSRASGLNIPYYFPDHTNANNRIPYLNFQRYTGISPDWPFLNGFFYRKLTDNLSWHHDRHDFRFGGLLTYQGKNEDNSNYLTNGSFTFNGTQTGNDLADMLLGFADQYSEDRTDPMQHLRYWDAEAYIQDQWRLSSRLSATYGLRYTYFGPEIDQNDLNSNFLPSLYNISLAPTVNSDGTLSNIPSSQLSSGVYMPTNGLITAGVNSPYGSAIYKSYKLNLSPRLGFSYDLFGNGKTAIRAGYGRYFDRTAPYGLGAKTNPPFNSSVTLYNVTVDNPGGSGGTTVSSPVSLYAFNTHYHLPYSQQWSLGVEQQIGGNAVLNVSYIGTKGTRLLYLSQANANTPNADVAAGNLNVNQVRPYQGYGSIGMYTPSASSTYHGLQMSVKERLGKSLNVDVAYTFSKVLTDAPFDTYSPQDSRNPSADRGLASFDRPHILVASYVWLLPSFSSRPRIVRGAMGGWQWAGILTARSGAPLTIYNNVYLNSGVVDSSQRPNLSGQKIQPGKAINNWLNIDAFSDPAKGTFGNAGVGIARAPHQTQFDSSISKDFPLVEQLHMEFKAEAINLFNHTIFDYVDSYWYPGSTTFGHVTSATNPRKTQVGIHFIF